MYDITAIGNSPVDVLTHVSEDFIKKYNLRKRDFNMVSPEVFSQMTDEITFEGMESGGSVANTAWTLAALGKNVHFIGHIGEDPAGRHFYKDMKNIGIHMAKPTPHSRTMEIYVLITPEGERTFASRGVTAPITPEMVNEEAIKNSQWLLVEGYTLLDQEEAVLKATEYALKHNTRIAFAISSSFVVDMKFNTIAEKIIPHANLLIANEEEFEKLASMSPTLKSDEAQIAFFQHLNIPEKIVTHAEKGATFISGEDEVYTPTTPIENPLDVTGAGDTFCAGFLYGFMENDIHKGLQLGHTLAGQVIMQLGARLKDSNKINAAKNAA